MELEDKFEVIPIIVTTCKKNHGLLGNYVLNINSTKLINEIKLEKTGKVKKFKVSLKLKENVSSSYCERKITSTLLPLVARKLQKLIEQDLLEPVPPEGSKRASPIVVLRKSNGDIRICGDYKISYT